MKNLTLLYKCLLVLLFSFSFNCFANPSTFVPIVEGSGRPMILLPGVNSSPKVWSSVVDEFKGSLQTHSISIKGFAGEPLDVDPSIAKLQAELIAYIKDNKLEKPIVVGHAFGAILAFLIAREEPELIGHLIVVDMLAFYPQVLNPNMTAETMRGPAEAMKNQLMSADEQMMLEYHTNTNKTYVSSKSNQKMITDWAMASDKRMTVESYFALFTNDFRETIANFKMPTLILGSCAIAKLQGGTQAMMKEIYESQYKKMPNKKIVVHRDAMHYMMLDAPKWVNKQIASFIKKN